MKYPYLSDCHCHSNCSFDADDPVNMLCENAIRQGLYALTVTDHCECNVYHQTGALSSIRQSFLETKKAAALFQGELRVLKGIELGQPLQNPSAAQEVLQAFPFDFVLASLHNLRGMPDFYFLDYTQIDVQQLLTDYFQQVLEMARQADFDSLAHLSYPLRYAIGEYGLSIPSEPYAAQIDAILQTLVERDKALEVNTSGLRQKIGETLPSFPVIRRFRELGGRYVTIGSDAHRWGDIGSGLEEGLARIREAGFSSFTIFMERKPHLLPIV